MKIHVQPQAGIGPFNYFTIDWSNCMSGDFDIKRFVEKMGATFGLTFMFGDIKDAGAAIESFNMVSGTGIKYVCHCDYEV